MRIADFGRLGSYSMSSSTRFAIWALVLVTAACAALATFIQSETLAIIAAGCATTAVVLGFSTATGSSQAQAPAAVQLGYDATTSATVDVLDPPKPVVFESPDMSGDVIPPATERPQRLYEAAGRVGHLPQVWPAPLFAPKMPVGSEPAEVVAALLSASRVAGHPIAAHLWLSDDTTDTLRLVEGQGDAAPPALPVSLAGGLLGAAASTGSAQLGPLEAGVLDGPDQRWRYALPLGAEEPRGVAAVDFEGPTEPDRAILTSISSALRPSLSGALALHVAHIEAQTARILVQTCTELSRALDPDDVLHSALARAMDLACAQTGSIMLLDPSTRRMRIAASRGLPEEIVHSTDISEGDGIAGWVLASRQPLVIEDLKAAGIRSRRHGIRSAVCVPLADEQGIIGVLNVGSSSFQARPSKAHLATLEALGQTIVMALRQAWAAEGAKDRYFDTLKALALALEARDPYARGGTARIVELCAAMGARFRLTAEASNALRIAAMLHDVGMSASGVRAAMNDGPLSTVEWGMLKMHPVIAAEILSQAPALADVTPIVYHHHEHFDGTGYVAGLVGTQIPLGARILAAADAYVAMTSPRSWRPALTRSQALAELRRLSGSQFDPRCVQALVAVVDEADVGFERSSGMDLQRTTAAH